tara:strand:- start:15557 stop:15844 length:288 start_codon:yes stop_codon:yes gene_type:complete
MYREEDDMFAYNVSREGKLEACEVPPDFRFDEEHTLHWMRADAALEKARLNACHARNEARRRKGDNGEYQRLGRYIERLENDPEGVIAEAKAHIS